jgi:hypothetical protein
MIEFVQAAVLVNVVPVNVKYYFTFQISVLTPLTPGPNDCELLLECTTMTLNLEVHLPSCLIEDGNYADICVGERRKFDLEFWTSSPQIRSAENVYSSC